MTPDPDRERGIDYADGGVSDLNVYYPDPEQMKRYNQEWSVKMTRTELVETLDNLAWSARRYGHDDYGLDGSAVDVNGNPVADNDDNDGGYYHPESVNVANALIAAGFPVV